MSREKTRLFCPGTSDLNGMGKGLTAHGQLYNQHKTNTTEMTHACTHTHRDMEHFKSTKKSGLQLNHYLNQMKKIRLQKSGLKDTAQTINYKNTTIKCAKCKQSHHKVLNFIKTTTYKNHLLLNVKNIYNAVQQTYSCCTSSRGLLLHDIHITSRLTPSNIEGKGSITTPPLSKKKTFVKKRLSIWCLSS